MKKVWNSWKKKNGNGAQFDDENNEIIEMNRITEMDKKSEDDDEVQQKYRVQPRVPDA